MTTVDLGERGDLDADQLGDAFEALLTCEHCGEVHGSGEYALGDAGTHLLEITIEYTCEHCDRWNSHTAEYSRSTERFRHE